MRIIAVGNSNIGVRNPGKSGQPQMTATMSQQGAYVMGDNECTQQGLIRLVGCRDPKARADHPGQDTRIRQFGEIKR